MYPPKPINYALHLTLIYLRGPKLHYTQAMNVTGNKRDVSFIIDKYFAPKKSCLKLF